MLPETIIADPRSAQGGNLRRSAWFATQVMMAYGAFALLLTAPQHFNLSVLTVAGDSYVDPARADGFYVRRNSDGYDGQFYARIAIEPLSVAPRVNGIAFDDPAWRMHRIVYPLLAHLVSLGRPAFVPASLLLVNLAGLGALGWLAWSIAYQQGLPRAAPFVLVAWPGFAVAISHDTTEIIAALCVLGAADSWMRGRLTRYALLGAAATLTRETSILLLLGVAFVEAVSVVHRRRLSWRFAMAGLAIVPFVVWNMTIGIFWHAVPQGNSVTSNLALPLFGPFAMMAEVLLRLMQGASGLKQSLLMLYILASATSVLIFCGATLRVAWRLLQRKDAPEGAKGLAAGFLATLALMSVLSANGPWVEPAAYFRAFSESFVIGCYLIALAMTLGNAAICFTQLR
jgi:hypothetical protein